MFSKRNLVISLAACIFFMSGCSQNAVKPAAEVTAEKPLVVLAAADKKIYTSALNALKAGKLDTAEKSLDSLIKKYPQASGPLANKGILLVKKDQLKQAEAMFKTALEHNPKLVPAMNHLAVLYRKQGRFNEAREMFDTAIATDPYYNLAYYNLGILYELYLQNPEKALENYRLYLDLKKGEDKEVAQWVSLLQRQIGQAK